MNLDKLRDAWVIADPADRVKIEAQMREARNPDDDHPYGAVRGGRGGGGSSEAKKAISSAKASATRKAGAAAPSKSGAPGHFDDSGKWVTGPGYQYHQPTGNFGQVPASKLASLKTPTKISSGDDIVTVKPVQTIRPYAGGLLTQYPAGTKLNVTKPPTKVLTDRGQAVVDGSGDFVIFWTKHARVE